MREGDQMNHQCAKCGKDAPYFTELFYPLSGQTRTFYLCKDHHMKASIAFVKEVIG